MSQTFEPQILNHPLIQHKISLMRKKETGSKDFRELASEVATLMCYEATRDLPLKEVTVETPICRCKTKMIAGRKLAIVPILRAGLGMVDGMLTLIPAAKVGHIGLYRDEETAKPIEYFCKLPCDISEREVIVVDPMLATGGSAIDAVSMIKKHGAANIKFMCIIAAPEGLAAFGKVHPDVKVYVGVLDEKLTIVTTLCRVSAMPATAFSVPSKINRRGRGSGTFPPFSGFSRGQGPGRRPAPASPGPAGFAR